MFVLSLIYSYVAVCTFCAVRCVIIICFFLSFANYSAYVFNIICMFAFCFVFLFSILWYCIVLCIASPSVHSCLFPVFAQAYRPLPTGGNPTAVNKYHIVSCHISYHSRPFGTYVKSKWSYTSALPPPTPQY